MSSNTWNQTLISAQVDGAALTAAAAATCLPAQAVFTLPANTLKIGDKLCVRASGRISCVVTTPGTARYDIRIGGAVIFDSQAMNLNVVAKTNVGWWLDVEFTVRAVGSSANGLGQGIWLSEAGILTAVPTTGPGPGGFTLPYNTAPVVGANFNSTVSNTVDLFFTQTVATGSMTLHEYELIYKN
jgi:hypothetical protein